MMFEQSAPNNPNDFSPEILGELKMFATNQKDGEIPTVLVIEGFRDLSAINAFLDMLFQRGILLVERGAKH